MKTAMIWGVSGGIGRALAERLSADGWRVAGVCRETERAPELGPLLFSADVTQPHTVEQAAYAAGMELDAVDLWVYAIGDIVSERAAGMSGDIWRRLQATNLEGAFLAWRHSQPLLAVDAHLIFLGAVTERLQLPGLGAYVSAKAGLAAFVEVLGKEQRKQRVTLARPAAVDTPFWQKVPFRLPKTALSPADVADRLLESYESGHKGTLDIH